MSRLSVYLLRALPLLAALLLYGYSLRLPFFIDDGLHFAMIKDYPANGVPGLRFWGGAISFPYYRPAVFTVWEIDQMLVGGHFDPVGLHLLNVLCFGLAGVALGRLVERIMQGGGRDVSRPYKMLAGVIAGMTFVLFPFNFAAVILVAALFHNMLALFATLSILMATFWMDSIVYRRFSIIFCWLFVFFGVFSHENGVLILPLLVVLIALLYGVKTLFARRTLLLLLPIAAIVAVYLVLWATVPRANDAPRLLETAFVSLGILLQGLVYPFAALVRAFTCAAGTCAQGDPALLWSLIAGIVVVALVVTWWRGRHGTGRNLLHPYKVALYGLLWYVLGALPSALLLSPDYISGSPRLMMFSSLGAGIFWGAIISYQLSAISYQPRSVSSPLRSLNFLAKTLYSTSASWRFKIVVVLIAGLAIFVSVRFLSERRDEALQQSDYTWELLRLLERDQPSAPLVLNAPAFLAPIEANRMFLTGAEGVVFMDEYVYYDQQFWAQTGVEFARVHALANYAAVRVAPDVAFAAYETVGAGTFNERLHAASDIYATYFEGERYYPVYVGSPNAAGADEAIALFSDGLALTDAAADYSADAQVVTVTTRWQVDAPLSAKPFVHVLCDGQLVGQLDGAVWGEAYPFSQWLAGETQTDVRQITLRQPVTRECLRVVAGVYWEADGVRLQVTDAATGEHFADDLVPITLRNG